MSKLGYVVPELPKGYYFFVTDSVRWARQGYLCVYLMRKRRWLWDKHVDTEDGVAARELSVQVAMDILKSNYYKRQHKHDLCGAYPPKKLGST